MLIFMRKRTLVALLAISFGMPLLVGCGSQNRQGHDGAVNVSIDLNKTAPIGYEICGDRPARDSPALVLISGCKCRKGSRSRQRNSDSGRSTSNSDPDDTRSIYIGTSTPHGCSTQTAISPWKQECPRYEPNWTLANCRRADMCLASVAIPSSHTARSISRKQASVSDNRSLSSGLGFTGGTPRGH